MNYESSLSFYISENDFKFLSSKKSRIHPDELIRIHPRMFHSLLTNNIISTRTASPTERPAERPEGLEALEGMAAGLYSEAFNAIVALINRYVLRLICYVCIFFNQKNRYLKIDFKYF